MQITITIPSDFETEYEANHFRETFDRVISEITYNIEKYGYGVVGKYELETLEMLKEQFDYQAVTGDVISIEWINEHSDDYFISGTEQFHLSEMLDAWEKENESDCGN